MKKETIIPSVALVLLMTANAMSVAPKEITYQGRLLENGNPVTSSTGVTFALFEAQSGGVAVWSTAKSVAPDGNGVYTTTLGSAANPIPVELDALWLQVTVEGTVLSPRERLTAAPYAQAVGPLADLEVTGDVTVGGDVGIGTTEPRAKVDVTGGYVESDRFWYRTYEGVNRDSPVELLDRNGNPLPTNFVGLFFCAISGTSSPGTAIWLVKRDYNDTIRTTRVAAFETTGNTPEIFNDAGVPKIRLYQQMSSAYSIRCRVEELW